MTTNLFTNLVLQAFALITQVSTNDVVTGKDLTLRDGSAVPIVSRTITTNELWEIGIIINSNRITLVTVPRQITTNELIELPRTNSIPK